MQSCIKDPRIRERIEMQYLNGENMSKIARQYGVSSNTVSNIVMQRRYNAGWIGDWCDRWEVARKEAARRLGYGV